MRPPSKHDAISASCLPSAVHSLTLASAQFGLRPGTLYPSSASSRFQTAIPTVRISPIAFVIPAPFRARLPAPFHFKVVRVGLAFCVLHPRSIPASCVSCLQYASPILSLFRPCSVLQSFESQAQVL